MAPVSGQALGVGVPFCVGFSSGTRVKFRVSQVSWSGPSSSLAAEDHDVAVELCQCRSRRRGRTDQNRLLRFGHVNLHLRVAAQVQWRRFDRLGG